jgi:hypothetical protein
MGQAPQANPSVGAAIVPGDAAGVVAALSPPDVLPAPAPASAEAVAVLPVEPPVAADAGMAEVPLLEVVSDLPSLGHKEGAVAVAEVGDRKPTSLAEVVPDASTAGGPDALEEGCAEPWPVLGSGDLIPAWRDPNEWRGQALRFWTCGASKPSSSLTMSGRSSLGMSSVSMPRQRWSRFSRPWRSFPGTFPGSSR